MQKRHWKWASKRKKSNIGFCFCFWNHTSAKIFIFKIAPHILAVGKSQRDIAVFVLCPFTRIRHATIQKGCNVYIAMHSAGWIFASYFFSISMLLGSSRCKTWNKQKRRKKQHWNKTERAKERRNICMHPFAMMFCIVFVHVFTWQRSQRNSAFVLLLPTPGFRKWSLLVFLVDGSEGLPARTAALSDLFGGTEDVLANTSNRWKCRPQPIISDHFKWYFWAKRTIVHIQIKSSSGRWLTTSEVNPLSLSSRLFLADDCPFLWFAMDLWILWKCIFRLRLLRLPDDSYLKSAFDLHNRPSVWAI